MNIHHKALLINGKVKEATLSFIKNYPDPYSPSLILNKFKLAGIRGSVPIRQEMRNTLDALVDGGFLKKYDAQYWKAEGFVKRKSGVRK